MRALLSRLLKDLSTYYTGETAHYNETDTLLNSCPGKCPRFLRMVNYKRSTARQGRSPLYLTWDAVILTQAALLGPISSLSLNTSLKWGTFLTTPRRSSYLAAKSSHTSCCKFKRAVVVFSPPQATLFLDVSHSFFVDNEHFWDIPRAKISAVMLL